MLAITVFSAMITSQIDFPSAAITVYIAADALFIVVRLCRCSSAVAFMIPHYSSASMSPVTALVWRMGRPVSQFSAAAEFLLRLLCGAFGEFVIVCHRIEFGATFIVHMILVEK